MFSDFPRGGGHYLFDTLQATFFKAVDGSLCLTCLPFTYGRKNLKYQKKPVKAYLLTLYVGKSINLRNV